MLPYLLVGVILFSATSAMADDAPPLTILLGAGARTQPAYDGSSATQLELIPVIRYYGQPWFMRTTFGMLEGGVRSETMNGLTLGLQLAYESGRNLQDDIFLSTHNLPTIMPSLSWGAHVEYERNIGPMPLILLLRYRQDTEISRGAQTDLRVTAGIFSGGGVNAGLFAQSTWADKTATNFYYGINAQQAAISSLPAYSAQAGTLFYSYGLLWSYDVNPQWMILGSLEARALKEAVSNSPIVQQTDSRYVSAGVAYQF